MKTPTKKGIVGKTSTGPRKLNARQERFCELIASGMSGVDAWLEAGYKVARAVARANAAESLANPSIAARIAELRAPKSGELAMTRAKKRKFLYEMAHDQNVSTSERIRAIAEDNRMAGHYEPEKVEVETGARTLESLEERAKHVVSVLNSYAQRAAKSPASRGLAMEVAKESFPGTTSVLPTRLP